MADLLQGKQDIGIGKGKIKSIRIYKIPYD
jgi:hypothetical protein